jgi:hypothetical protein
VDETPTALICIFNFLNNSHCDSFFSGGGAIFHGQRVSLLLCSGHIPGNLRGVLCINIVLGEVEGLVVLVPLACSSVDHVGDTLALLLYSAAINLDELIYGEEASANADDDGLALELHENAFTVVTVYSGSFSFEEHFASHVQWLFVDEIGELSVNGILLEWLVDKGLLDQAVLRLVD